MLRRLLCYSSFASFILLTFILASLTLRSFWAADSIYYRSGKIYTSPDSLSYSSYVRLTYDRGFFFCYINNQRPMKEPWGFTFIVADKVWPVMLKPNQTANYWVFIHTQLTGRPLWSSFRDPTGRDIRLLEEHYIVPAWAPLTLTAGLSLWLFFPARRAWRTARRTRAGLCLACGYELRAHAPGDKCPECGTPIPLKPVSH
jgi:hypothetical protein